MDAFGFWFSIKTENIRVSRLKEIHELKGTSSDEQFSKQQELFRRLEDEDYSVPYNRFFMDLDEDSIKHMEIVLGSLTTTAGRILAHALLEKHVLKENSRDSKLRII